MSRIAQYLRVPYTASIYLLLPAGTDHELDFLLLSIFGRRLGMYLNAPDSSQEILRQSSGQVCRDTSALISAI